MKNEWILDVLADLKNFAGANGLGKLEKQLVTASEVAIEDLVANEGGAPGQAREVWDNVAAFHRANGGRHHPG